MISRILLVMLIISSCLELPSLAAPNIGDAPSRSPISLRRSIKDPIISEYFAGELLFGSRKARHYLEVDELGNKVTLPEYAHQIEFHSDMGSYFVLGSWTALAIAAVIEPVGSANLLDSGKSSPLRGFLATAVALTVFQYFFEKSVVATYYRNLTIEFNRGPASASYVPSPVFPVAR